jgi:hypothetical protein
VGKVSEFHSCKQWSINYRLFSHHCIQRARFVEVYYTPYFITIAASCLTMISVTVEHVAATLCFGRGGNDHDYIYQRVKIKVVPQNKTAASKYFEFINI